MEDRSNSSSSSSEMQVFEDNPASPRHRRIDVLDDSFDEGSDYAVTPSDVLLDPSEDSSSILHLLDQPSTSSDFLRSDDFLQSNSSDCYIEESNTIDYVDESNTVEQATNPLLANSTISNIEVATSSESSSMQAHTGDSERQKLRDLPYTALMEDVPPAEPFLSVASVSPPISYDDDDVLMQSAISTAPTLPVSNVVDSSDHERKYMALSDAQQAAGQATTGQSTGATTTTRGSILVGRSVVDSSHYEPSVVSGLTDNTPTLLRFARTEEEESELAHFYPSPLPSNATTRSSPTNSSSKSSGIGYFTAEEHFMSGESFEDAEPEICFTWSGDASEVPSTYQMTTLEEQDSEKESETMLLEDEPPSFEEKKRYVGCCKILACLTIFLILGMGVVVLPLWRVRRNNNNRSNNSVEGGTPVAAPVEAPFVGVLPTMDESPMVPTMDESPTMEESPSIQVPTDRETPTDDPNVPATPSVVDPATPITEAPVAGSPSAPNEPVTPTDGEVDPSLPGTPSVGAPVAPETPTAPVVSSVPGTPSVEAPSLPGTPTTAGDPVTNPSLPGIPTLDESPTIPTEAPTDRETDPSSPGSPSLSAPAVGTPSAEVPTDPETPTVDTAPSTPGAESPVEGPVATPSDPMTPPSVDAPVVDPDSPTSPIVTTLSPVAAEVPTVGQPTTDDSSPSREVPTDPPSPFGGAETPTEDANPAIPTVDNSVPSVEAPNSSPVVPEEPTTEGSPVVAPSGEESPTMDGSPTLDGSPTPDIPPQMGLPSDNSPTAITPGVNSPTIEPMPSPLIIGGDPNTVPTDPNTSPTSAESPVMGIPNPSPVNTPTLDAPNDAPATGSIFPTLDVAPFKSPSQSPFTSPSFSPTIPIFDSPMSLPSATPTRILTVSPVADTPTLATMSPQSSPALSEGSELDSIIRGLSFDGGAALDDPTSPQSEALRWLETTELPEDTSLIAQRYALATLYYSTNSEWIRSNGWLDPEINECNWFSNQGSMCNSQGIVVNIDLAYNNLKGTIPPELGLLTSLQRLDLGEGPRNRLTGSIPTELATCTDLNELRLKDNDLTGMIPDLGVWSNLRIVDVHGNQLEGSLSTNFPAQLQSLNVGRNRLNGSIPVSMRDLTRLNTLYLAGNQFEGLLPLGGPNLSSLRTLSATGNQFTELASDMGELSSLIFLFLDGNTIQSIPWVPGELASLKYLSLADNLLTGRIPPVISALNSINEIDLANNALTGTIPAEMGDLSNLRILRLNTNFLTGEIPVSFATLRRITTLYLFDNDLTGVMPNEVCSLVDETLPSVHVDCQEVDCPCCNFCCIDGDECTCRFTGTPDQWKCF